MLQRRGRCGLIGDDDVIETQLSARTGPAADPVIFPTQLNIGLVVALRRECDRSQRGSVAGGGIAEVFNRLRLGVEHVGEAVRGAEAVLQAKGVESGVGIHGAAAPGDKNVRATRGVEREEGSAEKSSAIRLRIAGVEERDAVVAERVDAAADGAVVRKGPPICEFEGEIRVGQGVGRCLEEEHVRRVRAGGGIRGPTREHIRSGRETVRQRQRRICRGQRFEVRREREVAAQGEGIRDVRRGRPGQTSPVLEAITIVSLRGKRDGVVAEIDSAPRPVGRRRQLERVELDHARVGVADAQRDGDRAAQRELIRDLLAGISGAVGGELMQPRDVVRPRRPVRGRAPSGAVLGHLGRDFRGHAADDAGHARRGEGAVHEVGKTIDEGALEIRIGQHGAELESQRRRIVVVAGLVIGPRSCRFEIIGEHVEGPRRGERLLPETAVAHVLIKN